MAFNTETVTHHKDAAKHSGTAAEMAAKQVGLGSIAKKIGELVNKLVGKKQKAMIDQKAATNGQVAAAPVAPFSKPLETMVG
ncbi:hypothetical protein N0V90_001998 [Kalmusia sp. IMI 367209]|nr:hypothetical protein N0V90_001998 [Kalmusia sp. IMI 367209]